MKQLRPFIRYTVIEPPTSDDDSDPHVDDLQHKIIFEDGKSWYVMLRLADFPPDFLSRMTATTPGAMKATPPRWGVESEFLTIQALKKAGVDLVPNAYLPKADGVMYAGEYCLSSSQRVADGQVSRAPTFTWTSCQVLSALSTSSHLHSATFTTMSPPIQSGARPS